MAQSDLIKSSAPESWDVDSNISTLGTGESGGANSGTSASTSVLQFGGFTDIGSGFQSGGVLFRNSGYLQLGQGDNSVILDAGDATYRIWVGNETPASANFSVTKTGIMNATNGVFSGSVTASSGAIGGWSITATTIQDTAGAVGLSSAVTGGDDIRFWAGNVTPASAPFYVTEAGALVATSATITGAITANTGYIGGTSGWVIATGKITSTGIGVATSTGDATYAFWAGDDTPANAEFSVTHAGALVATSATISGAITATSGTVGGWTINSTDLSSGSVKLDAGNEQILLGSATAPLTGTGVFIGKDGTDYEFRAGNPAGAYMHYDGTDLNIEQGSINASTITSLAAGSEVAIQQWTFTGTFSVTDADTVAWSSGTLTFMDSTAYSISSGNTGDMAAFTYIYLDINVSTTVLQTATSFTAGAGKTLICTAQNGTSEASFLMMGGSGDYNIDGGAIAASSIVASKISVSQLSAISADLGTITSGTVTGATLQTASSGTRFVMDSTSFRAINSSGDNIFEVLLTGGDIGDVIMGDDASGQYAKWDESAGQFIVAGQQLNTQVLQIGGVTVTATAAELNTKVLHNRLVGSNVTTTRPDWVSGNDTDIYGLEGATDAIFRWTIYDNGCVLPVNDGTTQEWLDITTTYDADWVIASPQGTPTYIYTWAQQVIDSNWYLVRITVADKTLTEMTISGTAPDNDGLNKLAFDSNGDLFINDAGTTTVRKYTISGTTATYDSAITLSTATSSSTDDGFFIGENDDFIYYTGTANVVKRDNSSGTNQDTKFITELSSKILGIFYSAPYWYAAWMLLQGSAGDQTVEIQPFTWS